MFGILVKYLRDEKKFFIKDDVDLWDKSFCMDEKGNAIFFQGEIYNRNDLGINDALNDIEDTSKKLFQYIKAHGISALLRIINGIFAFAYYDIEEDKVYLVRDHAGIFPLYYYKSEKGIMFSSEVKEFIKAGVEPKLSPGGVFSYLANQSAQEPFTLIENIRALGPGELLEYHCGDINIRQYWNPANRIQESDDKYDSFEEAGQRLCDLIHDAINDRMIAGRKTGILLSGGIDSSAIVAISRILNPIGDIHTFTVTHDNVAYDERYYASLAAKKNHTIEHDLHISDEMIGQSIFEALDLADLPSLDGINSYFSSKLIKDAGFDTVVSGLGGEFFVEDDAVSFLKLKRKYDFLAPIPNFVGQYMDDHTRNKRLRYASMLIKADDAFFAFLRLLSDGQIKRIVSREVYNEHKEELDEWQKVAYAHLIVEGKNLPDEIARKYYYESRTWHVSTLLKDVMQNSVKQGIYPQFPLMDYRLIEYLFSLPLASKADFNTSKVHLVNAAEGNIPKECIYRKKLGFVFPFEDYFRGSLKREMEKFYVGGYANKFFEKSYLKNIWEKFNMGEESWAVIWKLFILNRWLDKYKVQI